jgi:hypothetical protein
VTQATWGWGGWWPLCSTEAEQIPGAIVIEPTHITRAPHRTVPKSRGPRLSRQVKAYLRYGRDCLSPHMLFSDLKILPPHTPLTSGRDSHSTRSITTTTPTTTTTTTTATTAAAATTSTTTAAAAATTNNNNYCSCYFERKVAAPV